MELRTTLKMCAVSLTLLQSLIADGSFNPEHIAESDYSHTTAILLAFGLDAKLKDIERVGIWLLVRQHGGLLAPISSMELFISHIHDMLKLERASHHTDH